MNSSLSAHEEVHLPIQYIAISVLLMKPNPPTQLRTQSQDRTHTQPRINPLSDQTENVDKPRAKQTAPMKNRTLNQSHNYFWILVSL